MTPEKIREINCGSYQAKLARGYTTGVRSAQLDAAIAAGGPAAGNMQQFNEVRSLLSKLMGQLRPQHDFLIG